MMEASYQCNMSDQRMSAALLEHEEEKQKKVTDRKRKKKRNDPHALNPQPGDSVNETDSNI